MIYEFVDTTDKSPAPLLAAEAVTYNGVCLDEAIEGFRTLTVRGREIADREIDTNRVGDLIGEEYEQSYYRTRTITVTYQIIAKNEMEFREYYNKLNCYLRPEQAKLVFADEPDKYFIATKASNNEVDPGLNCVTGTIEFLCADPRKYAVTEKTFNAAENDDGILSAEIVNAGTIEAAISYEITHEAENGYIGIVTENGVLQLGKADEADGYTYEANELIADSDTWKTYNDEGWAEDTGALWTSSGASISGILGVTTVNDTVGLQLTEAGTASGLSGAVRSFDVVDSNNARGAVNFYAYMNSWFQTGLASQTGAQILAFVDSDNNLICAQSIYKTATGSNKAHAEFWVGGSEIKKVLEKEFSPTDSDADNPFNESTGHSDLRKIGGTITFHWWGTYPSFYVPELASVKVDKVKLFIGQYEGRGVNSATYVTRNYFRRVRLQIMNVEKWEDVPNRYQGGDVVYIDGEAGKVYVNEMIKMGDEITGSVYGKAPPGLSTVEFYVSDFCEEMPKITATIREAWI